MNTIKLTKTYRQIERLSKSIESELNIVVDYDPEADTVEQVIEVNSYCYKTKTTTALTAIFDEHLQLDCIVDDIDWSEVYADSKVEAL